MAERHRLRDLEMGEAGHDRRRMLAGARHQRHLQRRQPRAHGIHRVAHPQAEIGRHLIVARARGVEPAGGGTDQLGQPAFHRHVDILEAQILGRAGGFIFAGDPLQPGIDRGDILLADDALPAEHRGMRAAAGDVLPPQPFVERDRGVDFAHDGARPVGETPAPHRIGVRHAATCPAFRSAAGFDGGLP